MSLKNKSSKNIQRIFSHSKIYVLVLTALVITALNSCSSIQSTAQSVNVTVHLSPLWAPYYEHPEWVRYYYIPDIECYYDVWNSEFVYLEDGNWMFGSALPPSYNYFDLTTCFVVVLNHQVHEPWHHFHYYVAHYPRYYYKTIYKTAVNVDGRPIRGFNENIKNVCYEKPHGANLEKDVRETVKQNEDFKRNIPERKVPETRPSHPMKYYGKDIGQPVKVTKNMMRPKEEKVNGRGKHKK